MPIVSDTMPLPRATNSNNEEKIQNCTEEDEQDDQRREDDGKQVQRIPTKAWKLSHIDMPHEDIDDMEQVSIEGDRIFEESIVADEQDSDDASENYSFDGTEIVTGVIVGGEGCAKDIDGLKLNQVTHVLSLITPFEQSFQAENEMVCSGSWKTFHLEENPTANLLQILDPCIDFICIALGSKGKVLIHSLEGTSRAVAVCIAYLVKILGMSLKNAIELVYSSRQESKMNRGFWRQLVAFEYFVRGCNSVTEEECPGAIIFEQPMIDDIIGRFLRSQYAIQHVQMSPTSGIANLRVNSPKRKMFDWDGIRVDAIGDRDVEDNETESLPNRKQSKSSY